MIGKFICLNEQTYNSEIPVELQARYARVERDDEGNLLNILPTTFAEVGNDNRRAFGAVVQFSIGEDNFYILEMEASWLNGEVSALLSLGENLAYPNNTLLTNAEAIELINEYATDDSLS